MACCGLKCATIVGLACCLLAVIIIPCKILMVEVFIKKDVELKPGSYVYSTWTNPPFPIYFEYYVFDVINPQEVTLLGQKPELIERGPYTYRLFTTNQNVTFNKNGTVSYRSPSYYVFDRTRSVGPETDTVITLNVILVTVVHTVKTKFGSVPGLMDTFLEIVGDSDLFIELSIKDLVWGYEDQLLKAVKELLKIFKIKYDDHFGFFYKINGTDDGVYTMSTGSKDINTNFDIQLWNGKRKLDYWTTEECNMINGTDGNIFHPFMNRNTIPRFFFSRVCRSLYLEFTKYSYVKDIPVSRYSLPVKIFQAPSKNPDNAGFCTPAGNCLPDGLYNGSVCYKHSPMTVSQPHFLFADMKIQSSVGGLHPDVAKHQTFVDVLAEVGAVINNQKSFQFNVFVSNTKSIRSMSHIRDVHFPVFWFKETSILTDKWAEHIKWTYVIPAIMCYCAVAVFAVAGVTVIGSVCFVYLRRRRKQKSVHMITESADDGESEKLINSSRRNTSYTEDR